MLKRVLLTYPLEAGTVKDSDAGWLTGAHFSSIEYWRVRLPGNQRAPGFY